MNLGAGLICWVGFWFFGVFVIVFFWLFRIAICWFGCFGASGLMF